jgi:hypothetical protein
LNYYSKISRKLGLICLHLNSWVSCNYLLTDHTITSPSNRVIFLNPTFGLLTRNSSPFMETEGPLTYAKQLANSLDSVLDTTGTEHHTLFFYDPISHHFPPTPTITKRSLPFRSSNSNTYYIPRQSQPLSFITIRGPQIFQYRRSHRQILGVRRVTWSTFLTEDQQIWSDLWTSLPSDTFCSVHVNWYFCREGKVLQLLCGKYQAQH